MLVRQEMNAENKSQTNTRFGGRRGVEGAPGGKRKETRGYRDKGDWKGRTGKTWGTEILGKKWVDDW